MNSGLESLTHKKYPTKKDADNNEVSKINGEYVADDFKILEKNDKTKCIVVCESGQNEYNRISGCSTTKKKWDTLVNTHEGTT